MADAVTRAQKLLDAGTTLFAGAASAGIDPADLREFQLLTAKPFLYVFNSDTDELADPALRDRLAALVAPAEAIFLDAKTEADLAELPEDRGGGTARRGRSGGAGLDQPARAGFRRWACRRSSPRPEGDPRLDDPGRATAPEAAGVIHTDFQRGFIKAEIVSYDDLIAAGSLIAARAAGKVRIEGKDYVMRDGDVVEFRHSATSHSGRDDRRAGRRGTPGQPPPVKDGREEAAVAAYRRPSRRRATSSTVIREGLGAGCQPGRASSGRLGTGGTQGPGPGSAR